MGKGVKALIPDQTPGQIICSTPPPYRLVFEIRALPKTANELLRKHRMVVSANANLWKKLVYVEVCRRLPPEPLTRAKLRLTRYGTRALDYDGLVTSFKPVVDGLVTVRGKRPAKARKGERGPVIWPGVLAGDGWAITGQWDVTQVIVPAGEERIRVEVEEVLAPS